MTNSEAKRSAENRLGVLEAKSVEMEGRFMETTTSSRGRGEVVFLFFLCSHLLSSPITPLSAPIDSTTQPSHNYPSPQRIRFKIYIKNPLVFLDETVSL